MTFPQEIEESLIWKLNDLGVTRHAVQHPPDFQDQKVLLVWLTTSDWSEKQRKLLLASLEVLSRPFGLPSPKGFWEKVSDEDWSISWKKYWKPDPIGENILILPSWLEIPEDYKSRLVVKIDPGSAFGTGSHPTTRLCLEALERIHPEGYLVSDLGCGSGILSIAALGLKAEEVIAVDIDSLAVGSTVHNRSINKYSKKQLKVDVGSVEALKNLQAGRRSNLLLCNILASVIQSLAPDFDDLLAVDGRAILSGFLVDQIIVIKQSLERRGWIVSREGSMEGWGLIEIQRC